MDAKFREGKDYGKSNREAFVSFGIFVVKEKSVSHSPMSDTKRPFRTIPEYLSVKLCVTF